MKTWLRSRMAATLPLVTCLTCLAAQAQDPVLVVSVKSTNELLGDVKYVLTAAGQSGLGALLDGLIDQFTQGKGLAGLDNAKPFGAYMSLSPDGQPDMPVAFLPVSDEKAFRDLLRLWFPMQEDKEGGSFTVQGQGQVLHARITKGYCYVGVLPTSLEKLPDALKLGNTKYDLAVDVNLQRVPAELKAAALAQLELGAQQAAQNQPPAENEAERRGREFGQKAAFAIMKSLVEDSDRVTIGLDIDQKAQDIKADVALVAHQGSDLDKALAGYGKSVSPFAGVARSDAAMSLLVSAPVSDAMQKMFNEALVMLSAEAQKGIDNDQNLKTDAEKKRARDVFQKLSQVMQSTVQSGQVDGALVVDAARDGKLQVLAAAKVAKGDELGGLVDELVQLAKRDPKGPTIKLDAAKHAGTRIHAIEGTDEEQKKRFGDGAIYLGVRADSVWVAAGPDALARLQAGIDAMGAKAGSKRSPVSLHVVPSKLSALSPDAPKATAGPGDHISLELEPVANGVRVRLVVGEGALRIAGQLP